MGTVHPTVVEGLGNSKRELERLQNRPEHRESLQPTFSNLDPLVM
jgi:hypothetical protein